MYNMPEEEICQKQLQDTDTGLYFYYKMRKNKWDGTHRCTQTS